MTPHRIPLAGVIGSPVAHSRSPVLHRHWLSTYGLDGHYIPMDVPDRDLRDVIAMLPRIGFVGVNITLPHKIAALALADLVTDRATLIGAANTLIFRQDGKVHADNTDGYGFIANLRQGAKGWRPDAGPVAVLGAGGAARAVIASLIEVGAQEIFLANRTRPKAEALRAEFGTKIRIFDWVQAGNMIEDAATVVNTTSLGMTGMPELRVPLDGLQRNAVVTDLVYTPHKTRLLTIAEETGCVTVDGLGMLLHQAVPAFERWFGIRPEVDATTRVAVMR